ncbi:hypothetical protein C7N43_38215 [Sphingobacteriales bacterium UPWRP_1]|nr:hypothetical protein BVG80_18515 [Sphingobacteriales bacterium TSM_CSM]PSJ71658.1 hypothetical protein C7N43_38215 [Sphingobacteriales bacterium UPWRP_1]
MHCRSFFMFAVAWGVFVLPLLITYQPLHAQCWNLVWQDEFSGTALDTSKWSYVTGGGGWGNNELQYYTNLPQNTAVWGGSLHITALAQTYGGAAYTSARLRTKFKGDWRYGKIEARLKLPQGQGLWPAFWLLPTENVYGNWPFSGEIDVMELLGHEPSVAYGTVHAGYNGAVVSSSASYTLASGNFSDDFHLFAVIWNSTSIEFYIDGNLYATKTAADLWGQWPFTQLFHLVINLAVGGNWPGPPDATTQFPATMEADYIRVYQLLPDIAIAGPRRVFPNTNGVVYSLPQTGATTCTWNTTGGAGIAWGQGTPQIGINWGTEPGLITATLNNACGTHTYNLPVTVTTNLLYNGNFENDFAWWSNRQHNGATANAAITTTNVAEGSKAAFVQVTGLGPETWNVQLAQENLPLEAGQCYALSFAGKTGGGNLPCSAAVINSNNFTYYNGTGFTLTNTWQTFTFSFTAPENASAMLNFDMGYATGTYFFDNIQLHRLTPFIAGNPLACPNQTQCYTTGFIPGAAYLWWVEGGQIVSGQNTSQICVLWNPGSIGNIGLTVTMP